MHGLEIFVGEWTVEARFPGTPWGAAPPAKSVFEEILGGRYLVQRTEVPVPGAPDGFAIVATDAPNGEYLQHYYDSRGVTRLYGMTVRDGVWTLLRETADFSPLEFAQRFTGTFSADGNRIEGVWEKKLPGEDWELDFALNYVRRTQAGP